MEAKRIGLVACLVLGAACQKESGAASKAEKPAVPAVSVGEKAPEKPAEKAPEPAVARPPAPAANLKRISDRYVMDEKRKVSMELPEKAKAEHGAEGYANLFTVDGVCDGKGANGCAPTIQYEIMSIPEYPGSKETAEAGRKTTDEILRAEWSAERYTVVSKKAGKSMVETATIEVGTKEGASGWVCVGTAFNRSIHHDPTTLIDTMLAGCASVKFE